MCKWPAPAFLASPARSPCVDRRGGEGGEKGAEKEMGREEGDMYDYL